jgi:hypothetical protein
MIQPNSEERGAFAYNIDTQKNKISDESGKIGQ